VEENSVFPIQAETLSANSSGGEALAREKGDRKGILCHHDCKTTAKMGCGRGGPFQCKQLVAH